MKLTSFIKTSAIALLTAGVLSIFGSSVAKADSAEAADRAFAMAVKYSAMGYYMSPSKEGHGGFGVTYEFEIPVSRGLDYVFIVAGDRNCEDINVYIEAEETGNTIVKDTRRVHNGLAGTRWRSDYNGTVNVVVHFARVSDRCGWSALVGRRGTPTATAPMGIDTVPGGAQKVDTVPRAGDTGAVKNP